MGWLFVPDRSALFSLKENTDLYQKAAWSGERARRTFPQK